MATSVATAPASQSVSSSSISSTVASWLGSVQSALDDPEDPAGSPILLALVAIRRELEKTFAYANSTATPVQITQTLTGQVVGSVGLINRYDDQVAYKVVTQPTQGTVVVDSNGTFTYTPSATLQAAGGFDQFTVTVRDTSFHLFGDSGTITVPISVAVAGPSTQIVNPAGTGAHAIALSGDGKRAFVLNTDNSISLIDTDASSATYNQIIGVVPFTTTITDSGNGQTVTYTPNVTALATDSTGSKLYVTSKSTYLPSADNATPVELNKLSVLSISTATSGDGSVILSSSVLGTADTGDVGAGLAVSADGSRVYVLTTDPSSGAGKISTIDPTLIDPTGASVGAFLGSVAVGTGGQDIGVDSAGRVWVANSSDNTVSVLNPANNAVTTIAVGGRPEAIAFGSGPSGTGSYAYVANFLSNSVSVIDTDPTSATYNTVLANVVVGGEPTDITVSADGKHLYVAQSYTNSVAIIDTATNALTTSIATTANGGPTSIATSGDGAHVYVTNLYSNTIDQVSVTPTLSPTPDSTPILGSTKGFQVYNLSSQPATLTGYIGNGTLQKPAPGPGVVVAPGSYIDFEVVVYSGKNNTVQPLFQLPNAQNPNLNVVLRVFLKNVNVTRHIARCGADDGNQCIAIPGYKVGLLDPSNTVVTLDATQNSQAQQISQALNELCFNGSPATCNFDATKELLTHDKAKQVGNAVQNDTNEIDGFNTTVSRTITEQVQDTVQVSIGNKSGLIFEKVEASVTVTFQHQWSEAKTFSQSIDANIQPHYQITITAADPIYRDYGNFTLTMGNTTWHLNNIYFDSPRPNGHGVYVISEQPLVGPPTN
ncbi:beta-propeller fold lactonase family protein [Mycobacterium sp. DL592]|uniref:beta-propeller fold lactonase family protein n=1 Tax=Mycobacterium sp. DL592 TaxID=2675524 RepID=UPI00141FF9AB|nr:beta-propeller fold lactonase family protein [Mycobacterium sp. DL592]